MEYNDYISFNYNRSEEKPKKKDPENTPFLGWWTSEGDRIEAKEISYEDDEIQYFVNSAVIAPKGISIKYEYDDSSDEGKKDELRITLRDAYKRKGKKCFEPIKENCPFSLTELEQDEHFQSELKKVKEKNKKRKPLISSSSDKILFYKENSSLRKDTLDFITEHLTTPLCSYCKQKHHPFQCERSQKMKKSCDLCKSTLHNTTECLLNNPLPRNGIKVCFKCGKIGHLYCVSATIQEPYFFGNDNDPQDPDIDLTSPESLSYTYHNPCVLTGRQESILIKNKNFYDEEDSEF